MGGKRCNLHVCTVPQSDTAVVKKKKNTREINRIAEKNRKVLFSYMCMRWTIKHSLLWVFTLG